MLPTARTGLLPVPLPMFCPLCRDHALIVATDLRGGVDGRCPGCGGRWCGTEQAVALGLFASVEDVASRAVALAECPQCRRRSLSPVDTVRPVPQRPLHCGDCDGIWMHGATVRALQPSARIGGADGAAGGVSPQPWSGVHGPEVRHGFIARLKATYGADHESDEPLPDDIETRPLTLVLALPVAALLVWVLDAVGLIRFLLDSTLRMAYHEGGHAVASWLTGRLAIPLPFLTYSADNSSVTGYVLTVAALAMMGFLGLRRRLPFWITLAGLGACVLLAKGMLASRPEQWAWIAWSGIGGEFALGTLCVIAFFQRLYHRPSWDVMRYVVLLAGLAAFLPAWRQWRAIAAGQEPFPLGSLLMGASDGDMNRLLATGLSQMQIVESYLQFARLCAAAIVAFWLWTAWRAWMAQGDA